MTINAILRSTERVFRRNLYARKKLSRHTITVYLLTIIASQVP